jgi:light-harvesting complex I chlorophyll a/b binding protein 1
MLAVELSGNGNWIDAPMWAVNGGAPTYLGNSAGVSDLGTLAVIELATMGFAESLRGAESGEKRIYPGGQFDPMGMSKGNLAEMQLKEIKNGRLAMIACMGFFSQGAVTHEGPLAALAKHLADPWNANCATNNISIPPFHADAFVMGNDLFWKAALPNFLV